MARTTRKRVRPRTTHADGALALAVNALFSAVGALCNPRPYPRPGGGYDWTDSRYGMLREGIGNAGVSGRGHSAASSLIPLQLDYLKLALKIDTRVRKLYANTCGDTPNRLHQILKRSWRPQDARQIECDAAEIASWNKAIDDLLAPPTTYLRGIACPQCSRSHTYKWSDEGERVRTPALAMRTDLGVWCQGCRATWDLGQLGIFSRVVTA